jgi:hypothetical protein
MAQLSNDSQGSSPDIVPQSERVQRSLQLGWAFVEVRGRLKSRLFWRRTPEEAQRLFISHPKTITGEDLWLALRRLLIVADLLFPASEEEPSSCPPPPLIAELPATMEQLLYGEKEDLPSEESIFEALNHWSRDCWVQLGTEDPVLAQAASLGGSLADTYWHMRLPERGNEPSEGETWAYLLRPRRLNILIKYTRCVEPYLPSNFGRMLRHSLWDWGIADALTRENGELRIACPRQWARLEKQEGDVSELKLGEAKELRRHLKDQYDIWKDLVFGHAPLLLPSDWRHMRWATRIVYAVVVAVLMIGASAVIGGLVVVSFRGLTWALEQIGTPGKFEEWLSLGSVVASGLGFLGTQLWHWGKHVLGLYDNIYDWFMEARQKQRSLHRWSGETKSILNIWLQQLFLPKAR